MHPSMSSKQIRTSDFRDQAPVFVKLFHTLWSNSVKKSFMVTFCDSARVLVSVLHRLLWILLLIFNIRILKYINITFYWDVETFSAYRRFRVSRLNNLQSKKRSSIQLRKVGCCILRYYVIKPCSTIRDTHTSLWCSSDISLAIWKKKTFFRVLLPSQLCIVTVQRVITFFIAHSSLLWIKANP